MEGMTSRCPKAVFASLRVGYDGQIPLQDTTQKSHSMSPRYTIRGRRGCQVFLKLPRGYRKYNGEKREGTQGIKMLKTLVGQFSIYRKRNVFSQIAKVMSLI